MGVFGGGEAFCCRTPTVAAMLRSRISLEVRKIPRLTMENAILFFAQVLTSVFLNFSSIFATFSLQFELHSRKCATLLFFRDFVVELLLLFRLQRAFNNRFFRRCTTKKCLPLFFCFVLLHFVFESANFYFDFSVVSVFFFFWISLLGSKHNRSLKRSNSFWKPSLRKEKKSTSTPVKAERSFWVCVSGSARVWFCVMKRERTA